jgi:hypothetical protein
MWLQNLWNDAGRSMWLLAAFLLAGSCLAEDKAAGDALVVHGLFAKTAPRPAVVAAVDTNLPLKIKPGARIAFIGNTLFERAQQYGHFEAMLHQYFPQHRIVARNLAWSADTIDVQPRPENFADIEQHLYHEKIDIIFAAFGFNESFADEAGLEDFRDKLSAYLGRLKTLGGTSDRPGFSDR